MSQNILKLKDINCFKRKNILKTITTSFTSFSTHLWDFIIAITTHIVHEPRAEIWLIGTTRGGKCYHTFSESLECQLSE